ncbi:hypothetical protein ABZV67_03420 [Streptomyces sp. NPDC005065]|uniref:AraC-like ligand-binding domain-containing protein n=1 Tax=unclassified Streptomyces TaxID=2593676 RepID=UPI0033AE5E5F
MLSAAAPEEFCATSRAPDLAAMDVVELTCSPSDVLRTPKLIRQADPELHSIVFPLRRELEVTQLGSDATSGAHDLALCDSSRPMTPKPSGAPCRISLPGSLRGSRWHRVHSYLALRPYRRDHSLSH